LLNFIFYYLLTLNIIIYKRNKNIHNLIFINKIYIAYNFKKLIFFLEDYDPTDQLTSVDACGDGGVVYRDYINMI